MTSLIIRGDEIKSQVTALEAENFKHPDYDYELEIGSFTA